MALFRKIWAVYAVALFVGLMLPSIPILLLNMILTPGKTALKRNIYYLHHVFTPFFLAMIGIRLEVRGKEKIDPNKAYIIVSNHQSSLDFIVNAEAFPGVYRYLAKQELLKIPVFGWVVGKMCLIVDRSSAMSRARSVVEIKQQLAEGWSVLIYVEGSRNQTEEPLAPFFDGAFRIAIQTGAPIAAQTILNMKDISSTAKAVDLRPGKVYIAWDEPVETAGLTAEDIPALKEKIREKMLHHLRQTAT